MVQQINEVVLAEIEIPTTDAVLGMTYCQGKPDKNGVLAQDPLSNISQIKKWGASAVISLLNDKELTDYNSQQLGDNIRNAGLTWFHHPFEDNGVPTEKFTQRWKQQQSALHEILKAGKKVMIHCRGGKGRTGLICAQILLEMDVPFDQSVELVKSNRQGALSKDSHIEYLKSLDLAGILD